MQQVLQFEVKNVTEVDFYKNIFTISENISLISLKYQKCPSTAYF